MSGGPSLGIAAARGWSWSCLYRHGAGDEGGLLAPSMERAALVVDGLAFADELVHGCPSRWIAGGRAFANGLLGLRQRVLDGERALVERALLEFDDQPLDLVAEVAVAELPRVRVTPRHERLGQRGRLRIERLDECGQAERRPDPGVVRLARQEHGPEELA